jgi:hypothetical protein
MLVRFAASAHQHVLAVEEMPPQGILGMSQTTIISPHVIFCITSLDLIDFVEIFMD